MTFLSITMSITDCQSPGSLCAGSRAVHRARTCEINATLPPASPPCPSPSSPGFFRPPCVTPSHPQGEQPASHSTVKAAQWGGTSPRCFQNKHTLIRTSNKVICLLLYYCCCYYCCCICSCSSIVLLIALFCLLFTLTNHIYLFIIWFHCILISSLLMLHCLIVLFLQSKIVIKRDTNKVNIIIHINMHTIIASITTEHFWTPMIVYPQLCFFQM